MIDWVHQEEGYCEGYFKSVFFRDDDKKDILTVMTSRPDSSEYAEKCVEAFNSLAETIICEICKEIIHHVKTKEAYEGFKLPFLDNPLDILNYCWFTTLYTCAITDDNDIAYIVEGEGDWGNLIGFAIKNNMLIHVGDDYFDYMKEY